MEMNSPPIATAQRVIQHLKLATTTRLFGLERATEELLIAFLAGGHVLLEDVPGVGKTALARAFAEALGLSFRRIQCTPDLLPQDVVGGLVYNQRDAEFVLRKGPIFANVVLVDEINRALPRTQSALLEAMAEGQVTIDGEPLALPQPFLVVATQNPVESQGVFPLPEAELDRFMFKTELGYPGDDDDLAILTLHLGLSTDQGGGEKGPVTNQDPTEAASGVSAWHVLQEAVASVRLSPAVLEYVVRLARGTRTQPDVLVGASPRAMIMLAKAARAAAVLAGRDFVTPDDIQRVTRGVLFHRLVLLPGFAEGEVDPARWVDRLLKQVEVPIEQGLA